MLKIPLKVTHAALWSILAFTPMVGLVGCDDNDGPVEEMGEAVDDAAEEIEDAVDKD
jgi:hypothetical protein